MNVLLALYSSLTHTSSSSSCSKEDSATVSGDSVSPSSMVVNRQHVEKVAPPEITKNVRRMFESGEIADRHQVPKRIVRIEDEMAVESSGVFENQPTLIADDVIRDTGEYVSPRSEVSSISIADHDKHGLNRK